VPTEIELKNSIVDILIYLFENQLDDEIDLDAERDRIKGELRNAGFDPAQVSRALDWLHDLAEAGDREAPGGQMARGSVRIYTGDEERMLDTECRGLLYFLEHLGVLESDSREQVIDRVMALDAEIDLEHLKWVVLMVLFNRTGQNQTFFWVEDLVMSDLNGMVH
jgi:Smg protein